MILNFGGEKDSILGGLGKFIQASATNLKYKINPTAFTSPDIYQLSTDKGVTTLNDFLEESYSARDAIERSFGGLDVWFGKLSKSTQEQIQPLWDSIKDGSASVE